MSRGGTVVVYSSAVVQVVVVVVPVDFVADDDLPVDEGHGKETEPEKNAADDAQAGSSDKDVREHVKDSRAEVERSQDQHVCSADTENVNENDRPDPDDQVLKAVAVARSAPNDSLGVFIASLGLVFYNGVQHRRLNIIPCLLVAQREDELQEPRHVREEQQDGNGERDVRHVVNVQGVVRIVHIIIYDRLLILKNNPKPQ